MIIEAQDKGTFNEITHENDFYVAWFKDGKIHEVSEENDPLSGGLVAASKLEGFGATTFEELTTEIENRL